MKTKLTFLFTIILAVGCAGCGDNSISPDPRLAFEGRFDLDEYQFRLLNYVVVEDSTIIDFDTTLTVTENPPLFFESLEGSSHSMTLDPTEFIEVTLVDMWGIVELEFLRLPIVTVSGNAFEVERTRFRTHVTTGNETMTIAWDGFSANGSLEGDVLTFGFSMLIEEEHEEFVDVIALEGTASGVREGF